MATSSSGTSSSSSSSLTRDKIEILCLFQDHRRTVTFTSGASLREVLQCVKLSFRDILDQEFFLQMKMEKGKWAGEYVDVTDSTYIQEYATLQVVLKPQHHPKITQSTNAAIKVCQTLKSPSEDHRKMLNKLYPSGSQSKKATFIPTEPSVGERSSIKKKVAIPRGGKPKSVNMILLTNAMSTKSIPKGKTRKLLMEDGRVRKTQIRRSMNSSEVESVVKNCFASFDLQKFQYMMTHPDNSLTVMKNQNLSGDEVADLAGGGSLYLCQGSSTGEPTCIGDIEEPDIDVKIVKVEEPDSTDDEDLPEVIFSYTDRYKPDSEATGQKRVKEDSEATGQKRVKKNSEATGQKKYKMDSDVPDQERDTEDNEATSQERVICYGKDDVDNQTSSALIANQNITYAETSQVDRLENQAALEVDNRKQTWQDIRISLCPKFDHMEGSFELAFKLADGARLVQLFPVDTTLKNLYEFVFAVGNVDPPFSLFIHPHKIIPFEDRSLQMSDISHGFSISVEYNTGTFDPIQIYGVVEETQTGMNVAETCLGSPETTLAVAETERHKYMTSLKLHHGQYVVNRKEIYSELMKVYSEEKDGILRLYPFRIKFIGERAIDTGGVSRDFFSSFFQEMYRNHFEGSTLVTPSVHPAIDMNCLTTIGTIISHSYLVSGMLPIRIAFPSLASILLSPRRSQTCIPDNVLVTALLDSLSFYDFQICGRAFNEIRDGLQSFSDTVSSGLTQIVSNYGNLELPTPQNLKRLLFQSATCHFCIKPTGVIQQMHAGIPDCHKSFWENMSVADLYGIYKAMGVSVRKVLSMIETCAPNNSAEEHVLSYLRQYIGNLNIDSLRSFLRFSTGSCVYTGRTLIITFNKLEGLARRPISHACAYTLELPTTYITYSDFQEEFDSVLSNQEAFVMDAI